MQVHADRTEGTGSVIKILDQMLAVDPSVMKVDVVHAAERAAKQCRARADYNSEAAAELAAVARTLQDDCVHFDSLHTASLGPQHRWLGAFTCEESAVIWRTRRRRPCSRTSTRITDPSHPLRQKPATACAVPKLLQDAPIKDAQSGPCPAGGKQKV